MDVEHVAVPASVQRRPRALVADDEPALLSILGDLLRMEGYLVTEAANGEALFVELFRSFTAEAQGGDGIDLVVSDLWMPFAGGLEVLRRLRAVRRPTPFVIVTADLDPSLRDLVDALGGCLLAKPFSVEQLHLAICRVQAGRRLAEM
jgi:CheY-like chemotaxis protein